MKSWSAPAVPSLSDFPVLPAAPADSTVYSTSARGPVSGLLDDGKARLYVCGITPYDATHLGHASTYVAFDVLLRSWIDSGADVVYVQNTTDIDDPLLERAEA
ncbi:MAG TPA: cysteine--1-D-myo-inosityl 2-amino-2-deoxy-alpha-D-glucopyranoside ligase, partial [Brevibacterium ravenspurgense]|nr:cysteine--1-D-myo-inosityl 2-amino-2-deoxy-alpha-D-glucopyranoside ligase [Brevibacterium ravenspurgense]